jgi:hypothetical protein
MGHRNTKWHARQRSAAAGGRRRRADGPGRGEMSSNRRYRYGGLGLGNVYPPFMRSYRDRWIAGERLGSDLEAPFR